MAKNVVRVFATLGVVIALLCLLVGCQTNEERREIGLGTDELATSIPLPPMDDGELHELLDEDGAYQVGSAIRTDHFRIAYLDYEEDWEGYDAEFPPDEGYQVVRAYFRFENLGNSEETCGGYDFVCIADDIACDNFYVGTVEDLGSCMVLQPGDMLEGWVYFEVPESASRIELQYVGDVNADKVAGSPVFVIG